jgi:hypothetical protein
VVLTCGWMSGCTLLDVFVVWFSPDSVLEMHLHLMRKYCYRYMGAVPYILVVRCSPRGSFACVNSVAVVVRGSCGY